VDDGEDLYPPDNFAMLDAGVYRSKPLSKAEAPRYMCFQQLNGYNMHTALSCAQLKSAV
jgi:hypothetical protein